MIRKSGAKKSIKKAQTGANLSKAELSALAHQKRGMGSMDNTYVKKSGGIKNEIGTLTDAQKSQLKTYMSKEGTAKKIYEALPNVGRIFGSGNSAADIPKGSQLENQRNGGKTPLKKIAKPIAKKSVAKKSITKSKKK